MVLPHRHFSKLFLRFLLDLYRAKLAPVNLRTTVKMTSLTTALAWVPRSKSKAHPTKYVLDESELERVSKMARIKLDEAQLQLAEAQAAEQEDGMVDDDWEE